MKAELSTNINAAQHCELKRPRVSDWRLEQSITRHYWPLIAARFLNRH